MAKVTVANEPWLQNALPQLSKPEDNARKCLVQIDKATRETVGGKFLDVNIRSAGRTRFNFGFCVRDIPKVGGSNLGPEYIVLPGLCA